MSRNYFYLALLAILAVQTLSHETEDSPGPSESSDALTVTSLIDRSSHHHTHAAPTFKSIWKKKIVWKPRWVKTWQEKKVYVAVWKRMWGPAVINEWVPLAKPPPGWSSSSHSHSHVHHIHEHTPEIKHTSYGVPIHHNQYH